MSQNNIHVIIAEQNDRFRAGDEAIPGRIVLTQGIAALLQEAGLDVLAIVEAVRAFDTFTEDNDPHAEHDFGKFTFDDQDCYWKIDLYNPTLDGGSEVPTDLSKTHRVLTIMLTHEY